MCWAAWETALRRLQPATVPIPIEYIGTKDTFGESGKPTDLLKKYGLDTPQIVEAAEKAIARKKVKYSKALNLLLKKPSQ